MTDDEKAALADVYEKAAELLEEKGWRQGLEGTGVTYCVGAALYKVDEAWYNDAKRFFLGALELPKTVHHMVRWNDDPSRTKDEVINTLHALANKLR